MSALTYGFDGYILQSELASKSNRSTALFRQLKDLKFKKMGAYTCIEKNSLPDRFKDAADKCLDLKNFWSYSFISNEIGMCTDYFSQVERHKNISSLKIGHVKLLELNDDFVGNIEKGLTPFKIKTNDDLNHAETVVDLQGIQIGFY